ncbi:MAG: FAD-dependent oxidoreductase [Paracoccus sp. (in: a-proteobacteria)]|nr:FAD-dependent oxidoreductase [Paracoccus sp. (in: a-proteobacteria)]
MDKIVILGAGQAAASAAAKLRALGFEGRLSVIGDEPVAPYQRPPLSKAYLLGEMEVERLILRAQSWWEDENINLLTGSTAQRIDREARQVGLRSGEVLDYDALILTLGAEARRLPEEIGGHLPGVFVVRDLADVDAMAAEFQAGRRLAVIGGGYIGLEAAAVARKLGLEVTLIEAAPRILGRVAAAETADMIRALHLAHGVQIIEGAGVARITGAGRAEGVALTDGRQIPADFVITGIGIAPRIALAEAAGLRIDNGIACDAEGRTSDRAIWAAGDCASFPGEDGTQMRLESVGGAIDMAELVAGNILGAGQKYRPAPWFWSDQFDAKLQIAGLGTGADQIVRRQGDAEHGGSVWYYRAGRLIAVDALNDARAYMVGKRLIEAGRSPDPARVGDSSVPVKELLS